MSSTLALHNSFLFTARRPAAVATRATTHPAMQRPPLALVRVEASGLPADCPAHFDLRAEDGRVVAEGEAGGDVEQRVPALPPGVYKLRWQPANAVIEGRLHTFVPTVLERRVTLAAGAVPTDCSATYVCVRRAG